MKNFSKLLLLSFLLSFSFCLTGCSDKEDEPKVETKTVTIGFADVSPDLIGGPTAQGANLYLGDYYEVKKGYMAYLDYGIYAQFPINYGYGYSADFSQSGWGYSFSNGGVAVSDWHNMTGADFTNQLSVYNNTSPSGKNFLVAFGTSSTANENPALSKYSDYSGCGHIYITDSNGYAVSTVGEDAEVSGKARLAKFKNVAITNTTYTYLVMKEGNTYSPALDETNKGWFKVQFIAFNNDDPDSTPLGFTEVYLANFDPDLADGYIGIIDEWINVDLSPLKACSILVINFVGSDSGEWGLNTPGYCALDNFEITVQE